MVAVQVIAITPKGEQVLKSDKVSKKFGIGKVKKFLMRKTADAYTVTEFFENPYRIIVTIKPQYNAFVNINDILEKTRKSVYYILEEHGGSMYDIDIKLLEDYDG